LFFGLLGLVGLLGIGWGSGVFSSYAITLVAIVAAGAGNGAMLADASSTGLPKARAAAAPVPP